MNKSVTVLGETYTIETRNADRDKFLERVDGYTDRTTHTIVLAEMDGHVTLDNKERYQAEVLRHEIVHAFVAECGIQNLTDYGPGDDDEGVVDWFARMGPKIAAAWQAAGCME